MTVRSNKIALIAFGNEESYGLLFVGSALIDCGQHVRFFDAEQSGVVGAVSAWHPDFLFFSPMTCFFPAAVHISGALKNRMPGVVSVFGGHHVTARPSVSKMAEVDVVVVGPAKGSIRAILGNRQGVIKTTPTCPDNLPLPARERYYTDIPRMAKRYRKIMLSKLGCPWNCTYCSSASGHVRSIFGASAHTRYFLARRPLAHIMAEARQLLAYPTEEIEWVDDDILAGPDAETWLPEFAERWRKEIGLKMYVSTTAYNALKVSDRVLTSLREICGCIGMGVQAIRPDSLKLLNRSWDSERQMKSAYDRLKAFGFSVNLQCIVGLPVADPVKEALDTIEGLQRIGPGSICSCYPLMIYPGTVMERYCRENGFERNPECNGDTNSGIPDLLFAPSTVKRLRNICKLATLFVKYGIDRRWMRALIDVDLDDRSSMAMSTARYYECVTDRLKLRGKEIFDAIMQGTNLRY